MKKADGYVLTELVLNTDSLQEVIEGEEQLVEAQDGYGRCGKCSCKKFEGFGQQCKNCGHKYADHY